MKKLVLLLLVLGIAGCNPGYEALDQINEVYDGYTRPE